MTFCQGNNKSFKCISFQNGTSCYSISTIDNHLINNLNKRPYTTKAKRKAFRMAGRPVFISNPLCYGWVQCLPVFQPIEEYCRFLFSDQ